MEEQPEKPVGESPEPMDAESEIRDPAPAPSPSPERDASSDKVLALAEEEATGPSAVRSPSANSSPTPAAEQLKDMRIFEHRCYCGLKRNLDEIEFLCVNCMCWIHESCVSYQLGRGKIHPFLTNYLFVCKYCSSNGLESYYRDQATVTQMCHCAIANLQHTAAKIGLPQLMFNKDTDIIPYIEQNWEAMTTLPRLQTQSWHASVSESLTRNLTKLFIYEENAVLGPCYGLVHQDLGVIQPKYEHISRSFTTGRAKLSNNRKRKLPNTDQPTFGGKKSRPNANSLDLMPLGFPREFPYNKDGFKYILAEPDPHATVPEESDDESSSTLKRKPIPGWMYRVKLSPTLLLSLHDRAARLKVTEDRLAVTGERGYGMVRATHSVNIGCWYFEISIVEMPEGSATRLGWGRRHSNLQTPLGYDKFGYSWRSRKGTKFTESRGQHYSDAYGEGDTLGFLINLPKEDQLDYRPKTYKNRPLIKYKSHLYYEDRENVEEKLQKLYVLQGSRIEFFKNGESQGVAFENIYAGSYFPAISIHKHATASINFGPTFKYPEILNEHNARGMNERVEELLSEQFLADTLYLAEHNQGRTKDREVPVDQD